MASHRRQLAETTIWRPGTQSLPSFLSLCSLLRRCYCSNSDCSSSAIAPTVEGDKGSRSTAASLDAELHRLHGSARPMTMVCLNRFGMSSLCDFETA